jgi:hypothetical protein
MFALRVDAPSLRLNFQFVNIEYAVAQTAEFEGAHVWKGNAAIAPRSKSRRKKSPLFGGLKSNSF